MSSYSLVPMNSFKPIMKEAPSFIKIQNFEMEVQLQKKPKFLCLHGFRTSGTILEKQLGRWPEPALHGLDLVFLDGPFPARGKSDVAGYYDPPYYEWFQFRKDYQEFHDVEEGISYIEDYMMKHGPFDGLLGFSQGAVLSAALPGMQLQGVALSKVPKIKYVIIMSGAKFGGCLLAMPCKLVANAFSSPLSCPSLHVIGERDHFKEAGIELLRSFEDPFVIHHRKGHTVPPLDEQGLKTMHYFKKKIEKMQLQDLKQLVSTAIKV